MNWMAKLYETYEQGLLLDLADDEQLMPISHTVQNAHINVVIDLDGKFLRAKVLEKIQIVLPATESSAGRSSGEAPHPLADKLQYVAGDYESFGGKKKPYFKGYREQLMKWCESSHAHPHIHAVLAYVEKECLIEDLIKCGVCQIGNDGKLLTSWPREITEQDPLPLLFKVLPKEEGQLDQGNALVCWSVHEAGAEAFNTWKNVEIQKSWIAYDAENAGKSALCFVTGEQLPLASNHPAKLRHTGDKAKLISANDGSGFTYRGRFIEDENVANVSFDVTQKAHNALRWLIGPRKQAYRNGDQVVVSWAISGTEIPSPVLDLASLLEDDLELVDEGEDIKLSADIDVAKNLGQQFGIALKRYMKGYYQNFSDTPTESVVIMGLDSATPGRMAITYYRDFMAKEYLDVVSQWHSDFAWPQRVVKEYEDAKGKTKSKVRWLPGAPTPWTILNACYGDIVKSNDALKKQITERLLPCIVECKPLPIDLLQLAVRKASNPNSGELWEWEKNLGVACALYRGFHLRHPKLDQRRTYSMSLDTENNSKDYLYGRLLALAERLEEVALSAAGVNRPTTANRLMQRFADRPYETWLVIYKQLDPYIRQLKSSRPGFLVNISREIDAVMDKFNHDEFVNPKALSGEFLLGFHCQRITLHKKSETEDTKQIAVVN